VAKTGSLNVEKSDWLMKEYARLEAAVVRLFNESKFKWSVILNEKRAKLKALVESKVYI